MTQGLSGGGFKFDLAVGEILENKIREILGEGVQFCECKWDQKCEHTGNLFIEYECYGKPSGIATTTAKWWFTEYARGRILLVETSQIKTISDARKRKHGMVRGGDYNEAFGVLVPISVLFPFHG